ncbi:MAG: PAS domain S-box protein, partial [Candidatus Obscuribacterales bacterium]|nr:PAS domain S-box protein [Steroidobacteraceae bacterium]
APIKDSDGGVSGAVIVFRDVTERSQLESARRRSEQLLTDFFENAAIGLHWVSPDGKVIRVNRAELRLLGYAEEEYVGRPVSDFHADPAVIEDILARLARGETLQSYEARLRCKDGSIKYVLITSNVLWEDGQFIHSRCFTRDITAQKLAQMALQEAERRKSAILNAALDAIITMDHQGKVTDFNPAAEKIFGYERGNAVNRLLENLIVPQRLRQQHREGLERLLVTGESKILGKRIEMSALHADGSEFPVELSVIRIEGSDPPSFTATLRDIREAKKLQASQARLAAIVEYSDDGIVGKTLDGIVTSWNDAAQRIFGYSAEEMIGRSITTIIPVDRHAEETMILSRLRSGERIEHFDTVRVTKGGQLLQVSITSSPIRDSSGNIIGASKIVRDVTERKRVESALREADRRKDEFLATLAHEMRNPLAPILSAAKIVESPLASAEQKQRATQMIARQVGQMALLLNDLLDISRITLGKVTLRKERVDLQALIATAVETSRPLIEANHHTLDIDLPHERLELEVDRLRISQVLANLLTNSAKYTNQGGRIELRTTLRDNELVISVKDNGIGISADKIHSIFEMFSQVDSAIDRAQGGLGIGLSLVRGIVQLHGGSVTAHSEGLGCGSEFVVRLPRSIVTSVINAP